MAGAATSLGRCDVHARKPDSADSVEGSRTIFGTNELTSESGVVGAELLRLKLSVLPDVRGSSGKRPWLVAAARVEALPKL